MNPPVQLPQANHAVLGLAITGAPAQRIARIGGVGDQPAADNDSYDVFDQPGFWPVNTDFDSFAHDGYSDWQCLRAILMHICTP